MNEFSLSTLVGILKKCYIYVILAAIVFAVVAYCFCSFVATPTYQASASFVATNSGFASNDATDNTSSSKIMSADVAASLALINTYVDLLKSTEIYEMVKKDTGLSYTPAQIKSMVLVQPRSEESLFIDITVTTANKKHSVMIADSIYKLGGEYVVKKMPNSNLIAIEDSGRKVAQNYPNTPLTIVIASFLGAVVVYVIAVISNMTDKTIKGEKDFSDNYDIPVLGNIPNFKAAAREERK